MLQAVRQAEDKHRSVLALAAELEAAVARPAPSDPLNLFYLRLAFYSALSRRLHHHEHVFCSRLQSTAGSAAGLEARRIGASARLVVDGVADHLRAWPTSTVTQDWSRFCRETRALLATVKQHVRSEARRVQALLEADERRGSPSPAEGMRRLALA